MDFDDDTELTAVGDHSYEAVLSNDWYHWGINGGYVAAVALRAAGAESSHPNPASITTHFLRRAEAGSVTVSVTPMVRTSKAECMQVTIAQDQDVICVSTVWTAAGGATGREPTTRMLPAPETMPTLLEMYDGDENKLWTWQLAIEDRPRDYPVDWNARGISEPTYESWYRFRPRSRFEDPFVNAGRMLVIADLYPILGYMRSAPGLELSCRAATVVLSVQFHRDTSDQDFIYGEASIGGAADGLLGAVSQMWDQKGRCCASATQQNLLLST